MRKSNTATFGIPTAGPRCVHEEPPLVVLQTPRSVPTKMDAAFTGLIAMQLCGRLTSGLTFAQTGVAERALVVLKTCPGWLGVPSSKPESVT